MRRQMGSKRAGTKPPEYRTARQGSRAESVDSQYRPTNTDQSRVSEIIALVLLAAGTSDSIYYDVETTRCSPRGRLLSARFSVVLYGSDKPTMVEDTAWYINNAMQQSGMDYRAWYKLEEMLSKNSYITDYLYSEAGWNADHRRSAVASMPVYTFTPWTRMSPWGLWGTESSLFMGFMGYWISAPSAKLPDEANLELIVKGMEQGLLGCGMGDRREMKWMVREVLKVAPGVRKMGWDWE
ncbi:hypothetical protein FPQ18DRAFT_303353 [Pyronema domesticum]|nr:hypothetical protein FPQ18DRAFT_303353 [Pyronema domesticum]